MAKDNLWKVFHKLLDTCPRRSSRKGTTAAETEDEDVVKMGILPLANIKAYERSNIKFCAVDLDRIPKYNPEEISLYSMMASITALKSKVCAMAEMVNGNSTRIAEKSIKCRLQPGLHKINQFREMQLSPN